MSTGNYRQTVKHTNFGLSICNENPITVQLRKYIIWLLSSNYRQTGEEAYVRHLINDEGDNVHMWRG